MTADDLRRATTRIAHEVVERNHGVDDVVLLGLRSGGVPVARTLAARLGEIEARSVPVGVLDPRPFRDDLGDRPTVTASNAAAADLTGPPLDLAGKVVVLVDDVLFTGRTIRAALNAMASYGRPAAIQLAVVVDRGHRELPIRPDFVGKNLPTKRTEHVVVDLGGGVAIGEWGSTGPEGPSEGERA